MDSAWIAMAMGALILVASMASVELGISVALIEIVLGVAVGSTTQNLSRLSPCSVLIVK